MCACDGVGREGEKMVCFSRQTKKALRAGSNVPPSKEGKWILWCCWTTQNAQKQPSKRDNNKRTHTNERGRDGDNKNTAVGLASRVAEEDCRAPARLCVSAVHKHVSCAPSRGRVVPPSRQGTTRAHSSTSHPKRPIRPRADHSSGPLHCPGRHLRVWAGGAVIE